MIVRPAPDLIGGLDDQRDFIDCSGDHHRTRVCLGRVEDNEMNILIKNIEMPKDGPLYLILTDDGLVSEKFGAMYHDVDALWRKVPPHGDLIDRDELLRDIKERSEVGSLDYKDPTAVVTMILSARTVLEATNE